MSAEQMPEQESQLSPQEQEKSEAKQEAFDTMSPEEKEKARAEAHGEANLENSLFDKRFAKALEKIDKLLYLNKKLPENEAVLADLEVQRKSLLENFYKLAEDVRVRVIKSVVFLTEKMDEFKTQVLKEFSELPSQEKRHAIIESTMRVDLKTLEEFKFVTELLGKDVEEKSDVNQPSCARVDELEFYNEGKKENRAIILDQYGKITVGSNSPEGTIEDAINRG